MENSIWIGQSCSALCKLLETNIEINDLQVAELESKPKAKSQLILKDNAES